VILKLIVSICQKISGSVDLGQQDIEASVSAVGELSICYWENYKTWKKSQVWFKIL